MMKITVARRRPTNLMMNFPSRLSIKKNSNSLPSPTPAAPNEDYRWVPSLMGRLLSAFGIVHIVSEYGFELTLCEGPSMLPTIRSSGEIILVDRLTPRLRGVQAGLVGEERAKVARSLQEAHEWRHKRQHDLEGYEWHQIMVPVNELPPKGKWKRFWKQLTSPISIGDVVVVQHPDRKGTVCKRVLGLPGDMIVNAPMSVRQRRKVQPRSFQERQGLLVIPDGYMWIEGDNSRNSADSRNYGPVPTALIVGRVLCRVWPLRGESIMERGACPRPPRGLSFSGSTILPAGYQGEEIVKLHKKVAAKRKEDERQAKATRY
jgi:signal peptidase I